ncbi:unnamed protein product [Soboliphyme baturini]|uniref:Uncharacterized protein n=1 Tax=Soboliphyme baturini TaxID=241478 RepID=A0A183J6M0_9BILA|nr:unnamed protein product [Soboliphyme baturini]
MVVVPAYKNMKCDSKLSRYLDLMCNPLKPCCKENKICELMNDISPISSTAENAVLSRLKQHRKCWWFKKLLPANSTVSIDDVFDSKYKHDLIRNVLLNL